MRKTKILQVNNIDYLGSVFNGYNYSEYVNQKNEIESNLIVLEKQKKQVEFVKKMIDNEVQISILHKLYELESSVLSTLGNLSISSNFLYNNDIYKDADLVHYHQVHNTHLSLKRLFDEAKYKPTIMTLHDPWFLTGRCVHPGDCEQWKKGCMKCENNNTLFSLPQNTCDSLWKVKKKLFEDSDIDIVVASEYMKKLVDESNIIKKSRVHVIPFGLNLENFKIKESQEEIKKKLGIPVDNIVLFHRAQNEFKGTNYFIEALEELETNKKITVLTCGEQGLLKSIESKYNIVELGLINHKETLIAFKACDVFVMPSRGESFGMMALEAMASEKTVIVFDNTSLPEISHAPKCGVLVNNKDAHDLMVKIKWIVDDDNERIIRGKKGKQIISEKYTEEKYYNDLNNLYNYCYEKQKYKLKEKQKLSQEYKIDYNNINVKRTISKLKIIYNRIYPYVELPKMLKREQHDTSLEETIDFSDDNVQNLFLKFNQELYEKSFLLPDSKQLMKYNIGDPLVSIIIPVYNGSNYIKKAIESALKQTYKNIEIIIVNDGSNDNNQTRKIVEKLMKKSNKISYYEKENGGVASALNLALTKIKGEYVSWLSHDDEYYSHKIKSQMEYMQTLPNNSIIYSDYELINNKSHKYCQVILNHEELSEKKEYAIYGCNINGITLLIPTQAFKDVGNFNEKLFCTQDYDMWLRMMEKYQFVHMDKVTSSTRIHNMQTTNISEKTVIEGNRLWERIISSIAPEKMIEIEGSVIEFKTRMLEFLKKTPYNDVVLNLKQELKVLEQHEREEIKKLKVSLIVNCDDKYIKHEKLINKISNQTHKNIEIIVVNNTGSLLKCEEKLDNYIFINKKEKTNKSTSYNLGIEKATGNYVCFIDTNREYRPDKIEMQLRKIYRTNKYLCISNQINKEIKHPINSDTIMISNKLIKQEGIRFNEEENLIESSLLYFEAYKYTDVTIIKENLLNKIEDKQIDLFEVHKKILSYLLKDKYYYSENQVISSICDKLKSNDRKTTAIEKKCSKKTTQLLKELYNRTPPGIKKKMNILLKPPYKIARKIKNGIRR